MDNKKINDSEDILSEELSEVAGGVSEETQPGICIADGNAEIHPNELDGVGVSAF